MKTLHNTFSTGLLDSWLCCIGSQVCCSVADCCKNVLECCKQVGQERLFCFFTHHLQCVLGA